jgi:ABC-type antimicrobial peptide transport system permease subunit
LFYLRYIASELRRRKGRTVVTAVGLGLGVGLVVTVTALSAGLDRAQSEALEPLTGVGSDMSVSRPLIAEDAGGSGQGFAIGGPPGAAGGGLSEKEQRQLQRENGGGRVGLDNLGKPGQHFEQDNFMTTDLSFPVAKADQIATVDDVEQVSGALTLNATHVSGKVPKRSNTTAAPIGGPPEGGVAVGPPDAINLDQKTVSGIDTSGNDPLALVTAGQVSDGHYFTGSGRDEAVVSVSYANENGIKVGDEVNVGGHDFKVVGLADPAVGGEASDIYVQLAQLQKLSDRKGRINVLRVRADSSDAVASVASGIESRFSGSQVTTSADLADQVSGSLVHTKDLSSKLGTALAMVGLLGAFGIASLLTLSSVNKRTREIGTLKALGWRQRLVVRQVTGEAVVQGLIGGAIGIGIGLAGSAVISALGISLDASIASAQQGFGPPGAPGGFGQGIGQAVNSVTLGAPIDLGIVALAIGLAVLGGLVAGSVGGLRAARLRPAEALRSVE